MQDFVTSLSLMGLSSKLILSLSTFRSLKNQNGFSQKSLTILSNYKFEMYGWTWYAPEY